MAKKSDRADTEKKPEDTTSTLVHILSEPVLAFNEEITELRFREPKGADISIVGVPAILDGASDPPRILHDGEKMTLMIARLSGHSPGTIGKLSGTDWASCAWLITPFFMPRPGTI